MNIQTLRKKWEIRLKWAMWFFKCLKYSETRIFVIFTSQSFSKLYLLSLNPNIWCLIREMICPMALINLNICISFWFTAPCTAPRATTSSAFRASSNHSNLTRRSWARTRGSTQSAVSCRSLRTWPSTWSCWGTRCCWSVYSSWSTASVSGGIRDTVRDFRRRTGGGMRNEGRGSGIEGGISKHMIDYEFRNSCISWSTARVMRRRGRIDWKRKISSL